MSALAYLDYQATTPLAPEALAAMLPWLEQQHANPHSAHAPGRAAKAVVEAAREAVLALLPQGGQFVFTSGATEALNWALQGSTGPIVTLATEHAAVLDTSAVLAAQGRPVTVLPVDGVGLIDPAIVRASNGSLIATMLVNNEIGAVQPVAAFARPGEVLLLCDAVQAYGRIVIPDACDFIAISAHKIHGPKGIGGLWIRDGALLSPLLHGGGQERGMRSGTLSPALCAGFGAAAQVARERFDADRAHVARLFDIAVDRLGSDWTINGSTVHRYLGNLNIRRDGADVARLTSELRDIAFSAGSACASGSGRPSHVLRAIGLSDAQARSSIRLGFGRYTTEAELIGAVDRIAAAANAQLGAA